MSDINEKKTNTQEYELIMKGKADQGFLDIVKVLEKMGEWTTKFETSVDKINDKLDAMGKKLGEVGKKQNDIVGRVNSESITNTSTTSDGKGKTTLSATSQSRVNGLDPKQNAKEIKDLADATIKQIKASEELTQAQKEYTDVLKEESKERAKYIGLNANSKAMNAATARMEAPSKMNARDAWADNLRNPILNEARETKALYDMYRIKSGAKEEEDNVRLQLDKLRLQNLQDEIQIELKKKRALQELETLNDGTFKALQDVNLALKQKKLENYDIEAAQKQAKSEIYINEHSSDAYQRKREAQNLSDAEYAESGLYAADLLAKHEKKLADIERTKVQTERTKQLIENNNYAKERRYDKFFSDNMFAKYAKMFTERTSYRNDWIGNATKLGSILAPKEIFAMKNGSGGRAWGTGVSAGGFGFATFFTAINEAGKALQQFGKATLDAYGSISRLETSLEVVYGSKAQSQSVFNEIAEYATRSPFGVQQVTEMAILLKQSGIYESDLLDTLETIGDLAGGNEEKYRRIANNYAQVLAIGKATTKDMREFANAGIPIFEATADYLGISRKELSSEIEAGKITGQVIEGVFKQLTSEGGMFYQATEKGAENYNARLTNVQDFKQLALSAWGESFFTGARFGQYGESSMSKDILDLKENFWKFVKEKGEEKTYKESLRYVRRLDTETSEIKDAIMGILYATQDGIQIDPDFVQTLKTELGVTENALSNDERITILSDNFDKMYKEAVGESTGRRIEEIQAELASYQRQFDSLQELKNQFLLRRDNIGAMKIDNEQDKLSQVLYKLQNEIALNNRRQKKLDDLYRQTDLVYGKTMSTLINLSKVGSDAVNKNYKYNEGSVENIAASIEELWKNTDAYKQEQEKQREELLETNKTLRSEYENLKLANYSNLDFIGQGTNKELKMSELEEILAKFSTATTLFDGSVFSKEDNDIARHNADALLKIFDLTDDEKTELKRIVDILKGKEGRDLTEVEVNSLRMYEGMFSDLYEKIFVTYTHNAPSTKDEDIKKEEKKKRQEVTTPLWARIIGSATNTDAEHLDWTTFWKDENTNWMYGLKTFISGDYDHSKYTNGGLFNRGSMQSKGGVSALLQAGGTKYLKDLVYQRDSNGNPVKGSFDNNNTIAQYDWDKSFENLKKAALSLESSSEMTTALASYYETEADRFAEVLTSGVLTEEDWEKLTSEDYQKQYGYIGEEFEQLQNVLGATIVAMEDENGNVYYELDESAFDFIKSLEDANRELGDLAGQFSSLKQSIESLVNETEKTNFTSNAIRQNLFGFGLSESEQDSLISAVYSSIANQLTTAGVTDEKAREKYFAQTEGYINAAVTGDRSAYTEGSVEMALVDAMLALIDATKENTNAKIGLDVIKATAGTTDYGVREVGRFLGNKNNYSLSSFLTGGDLFGKDIKGSYITSSLGASDVSYDRFKEAMLSEENADILKDWEEITGLSVATDGFDKVAEAMANAANASNQMEESLATIANGSLQAFKDFAKSGFVSSFEEWGKAVKTGEKATENIAQAWEDLGASLASQISTLLITEGLKIAGSSALVQNWGMAAIGLGMVAAGGAASWLSGYLGADEEEEKKADDEVERLQTLKDMLADLLAQARIDAEYYEKNLRHQYAISANENISSYSVNDAVITPKGDIISTHPDDWLIATKKPQDLNRGGSAAPIVTITIVNESGSQVAVTRTEQTQRGNEIDVKAIIVAATNEALAMGGLDSGMQAYQQRQQGRVFTR